jgi:hypothetical protein
MTNQLHLLPVQVFQKQEVYVTSNYSIFKNLPGNREVNKNHIKKIEKSIKEDNYTAFNPIEINEFFQVLDGQHRLIACQNLNLPIYYKISPGKGLDYVQSINAVRKDWSGINILQATSLENETVRDILNLYNQKAKPIDLPFFVYQSLYGGDRTNKKFQNLEFVEKKEIENVSNFLDFLKQLTNISNLDKDIKKNLFLSQKIFGLFKLFNFELFDKNVFLNKAINYHKILSKAFTFDQALEEYCKLYNYQRKTNRIDIHEVKSLFNKIAKQRRFERLQKKKGSKV